MKFTKKMDLNNQKMKNRLPSPMAIPTSTAEVIKSKLYEHSIAHSA